MRIYIDVDPDDSFWLDSADISAGGVFLHTDLLFPVGEALELEFFVPGRSDPVRGRGRVVRVVADEDGQGPGVAVRLVELAAEERAALGRMSANLVRAAAQIAEEL